MKAKFILVIGGYAAATFGSVAFSPYTGIDPLDSMRGTAAIIAGAGLVVATMGNACWRIAARLAVAFGILAGVATVSTPWTCWIELFLIAAAAIGIEQEMVREKIPYRDRPHMAVLALALAMGAAVLLLNALPSWKHDPENLFQLNAFYAGWLYLVALVLPWLMHFALINLSRDDSS